MSERSVELHRRLNAAFTARDVEATLEVCDPHVEFHTRFAAVGGVPVYRGHDGFRTFMQEMEEVWGDALRIGPAEYFDLGERTLAFYVLYARALQSRTEVAMPATVLATWRDGLCIHWKSYVDREDALSELGVSGDELEPIDP